MTTAEISLAPVWPIPENCYAIEDKLARITRVVEVLEARERKPRSRRSKPVSDFGKLSHARMIQKLLRAELGIGPLPTGACTFEAQGVKMVCPTWERAHA